MQDHKRLGLPPRPHTRGVLDFSPGSGSTFLIRLLHISFVVVVFAPLPLYRYLNRNDTDSGKFDANLKRNE